jgi:pimeloyl-ACP methyl ester carboxylesterase
LIYIPSVGFSRGGAMRDITHEYAEVNGIRMHYARTGEGPLMLFLHGFPQCWYEYRHQLEDFSRDHLAVAPDLRGYNLSSKPESLRDSGVFVAVEDIRQLVVDHLGYEKFVFVGHDWGSAVAWSFAMHHPELLEKLVLLVGAHPALLDREYRENPEQQEASQYMPLIRAPGSEELLAADDFAVLRSEFEKHAFIGEEDLAVYREAWSQPGALRGMASYYRREGLGPETEEGTPSHGDYAREVYSQIVRVPTMVIYPDGDAFVRPGCHRGLERYVPDLTFKNVEGGTHWIAEEFPGLVNEAIREFVGAPVAPAA